MGRWKYINWLVILFILVFMYRYFFMKYEASLKLYVIATVAWLILLVTGFYIFKYRIKHSDREVVKNHSFQATPKTVVKDRPKVNFAKKLDKK